MTDGTRRVMHASAVELSVYCAGRNWIIHVTVRLSHLDVKQEQQTTDLTRFKKVSRTAPINLKTVSSDECGPKQSHFLIAWDAR